MRYFLWFKYQSVLLCLSSENFTGFALHLWSRSLIGKIRRHGGRRSMGQGQELGQCPTRHPVSSPRPGEVWSECDSLPRTTSKYMNHRIWEDVQRDIDSHLWSGCRSVPWTTSKCHKNWVNVRHDIEVEILKRYKCMITVWLCTIDHKYVYIQKEKEWYNYHFVAHLE